MDNNDGSLFLAHLRDLFNAVGAPGLKNPAGANEAKVFGCTCTTEVKCFSKFSIIVSEFSMLPQTYGMYDGHVPGLAPAGSFRYRTSYASAFTTTTTSWLGVCNAS